MSGFGVCTTSYVPGISMNSARFLNMRPQGVTLDFTVASCGLRQKSDDCWAKRFDVEVSSLDLLFPCSQSFTGCETS
jgi:hypothetical protein